MSNSRAVRARSKQSVKPEVVERRMPSSHVLGPCTFQSVNILERVALKLDWWGLLVREGRCSIRNRGDKRFPEEGLQIMTLAIVDGRKLKELRREVEAQLDTAAWVLGEPNNCVSCRCDGLLGFAKSTAHGRTQWPIRIFFHETDY
jgi:hypothetical protein